MIELPSVSLPTRTQNQLIKWQKVIDAFPDYATKVEQGKRLFAQRNRSDNATFCSVRKKLGEMCSGARRCGYCEDSVADEVEHIKPKSFYPEEVFVWDNYLYACGPCNGSKSNQFAIFLATTGELQTLKRQKEDSITPPPSGQSVCLNPRQENPLNYLQLDLLDTFEFVPLEGQDPSAYQRAKYTIEVLRLNRSPLPDARREAYDSYCARLSLFTQKKADGAEAFALNQVIRALLKMGHPTVWQEMKRRHGEIPALRVLFTQAPEALEWRTT